MVALERQSYDSHSSHLADGGVLVYNSDAVDEAGAGGVGLPLSSLAKGYSRPELRLGVGAVSVLLAAAGMSRDDGAAFLGRKYPRDGEGNVAYGISVYDEAVRVPLRLFSLERGDAPAAMLTGNEGDLPWMYAGRLDMYFAYPKTRHRRFFISCSEG